MKLTAICIWAALINEPFKFFIVQLKVNRHVSINRDVIGKQRESAAKKGNAHPASISFLGIQLNFYCKTMF